MINWDRLLVLPKRVSLHFKADDGHYLSATTSTTVDGRVELTPAAGWDDEEDPRVVHEVFSTRDGGIRIRSVQSGKFWRRDPKSNSIFADSDNSTGDDDDPDTLFRPIKLRDDIIAIRNLGNNKFCQTEKTGSSWLNESTICRCLGIAFKPISNFFLTASQSSMVRNARFVVREPLVVSRKIYDVKFHLTRARIYNRCTTEISSSVEAKNGAVFPSEQQMCLYTVTERYTWNRAISSVNNLGGMKLTIQSRIPLINEKLHVVELSPHLFTRAFAWGESESIETKKQTPVEFTLSPMTMTEFKMTATECNCDVPFSYTCHDTLRNGETLSYQMDDGVYTGVHCYNFKFNLKETKLTYASCVKM